MDYALLVQKHYEEHLPRRLAQIPEEARTAFFEDLGEDLANQVERMAATIAAQMLRESGLTPDDEQYLQKANRLETAQMQAEGEVLRTLPMQDVLPDELGDGDPQPPAPGTDPSEWTSRVPGGESAED